MSIDWYGEVELRCELGLNDDDLARLRCVCPLRGHDGDIAIPRDELDTWLLYAGINDTPREDAQ